MSDLIKDETSSGPPEASVAIEQKWREFLGKFSSDSVRTEQIWQKLFGEFLELFKSYFVTDNLPECKIAPLTAEQQKEIAVVSQLVAQALYPFAIEFARRYGEALVADEEVHQKLKLSKDRLPYFIEQFSRVLAAQLVLQYVAALGTSAVNEIAAQMLSPLNERYKLKKLNRTILREAALDTLQEKLFHKKAAILPERKVTKKQEQDEQAMQTRAFALATYLSQKLRLDEVIDRARELVSDSLSVLAQDETFLQVYHIGGSDLRSYLFSIDFQPFLNFDTIPPSRVVELPRVQDGRQALHKEVEVTIATPEEAARIKEAELKMDVEEDVARSIAVISLDVLFPEDDIMITEGIEEEPKD